MELPVQQVNDTASPPALLRALKRCDVILARTYADETALDGAVAYTAPTCAGSEDGNFTTDLRPADASPQAAEALLEELDAHYAACGVRCLALSAHASTWPTALREAARQRGFQPQGRQVLELCAYRRPAELNAALQIIPARAAMHELAALCGGAESVWSRVAVAELDEPRLDMLLGRLDGQPVGCAGVLTLGQVGVITNVYTAASARRQNVGKTLLAALIDLCSRAQFEKVILGHDRDCPVGTRFYAGLGFTPVIDFEDFVRPADAAACGRG